jgi:hypothetical protein
MCATMQHILVTMQRDNHAAMRLSRSSQRFVASAAWVHKDRGQPPSATVEVVVIFVPRWSDENDTNLRQRRKPTAWLGGRDGMLA